MINCNAFLVIITIGIISFGAAHWIVDAAQKKDYHD